MAKLCIGVGGLTVGSGVGQMTVSGILEGMCGADGAVIDGGWPELRFLINDDEDEAHLIGFEITSIEDIDALRRYCEMVLEHHKQGVLS